MIPNFLKEQQMNERIIKYKINGYIMSELCLFNSPRSEIPKYLPKKIDT